MPRRWRERRGGGQPAEAQRLARLGREGEQVARPEPDAALARDDPRVPAQLALQARPVEVEQLGGRS